MEVSPAPNPIDQLHGLRVLERGEGWVAVFKPSGMLVHRGWARDGPIAVDVARELTDLPLNPVHRLDRATSGVLLMAWSKDVARGIQTAFVEGRVHKRYFALVRGEPATPLTCNHPLKRGRKDGPSGEERVPAETRFQTLWTGDGELHHYSLVLADPVTGRMHQIRRHLKHISHPIIGDTKYGKGLHNRWFRDHRGLHRLALHAAALTFPVGPAEASLEVTVQCPLPSDLADPLIAFGVPVSSKAIGDFAASLFPSQHPSDTHVAGEESEREDECLVRKDTASNPRRSVPHDDGDA